MGSNPFDGNDITVTMKYGKGFEDPWGVFRGTVEAVRENIIAYFGFDGAKLAGNTLNEIVVMATAHAHGMRTAGASLGATTIPRQSTSTETTGTATVETEQPAASNVWGDDTEADSADAVNPLFAQVEAIASIDDLKRLWAENQAAFAEGELLEAYKAKGKALKAAVAA